MTTHQGPVLIAKAGHIASIEIHRREHRNSLSQATVNLLAEAFRSVGADPAIRCVVLRGAGEEAFCAGADLSELAAHPDAESRRAFFESIASLVEEIHRCPIPVVASVHGYALAGGCGLAAACDIALAADDAIFGLPEVGIGLAPLVVMGPISRSVALKRLSWLAMSAERISAPQALEAGLISAVFPKSSLDAETLKLCTRLCQQGPAALRATKAALVGLAGPQYLSSLRDLADRSALTSVGEEAAEGIQAFKEKRAPSWRP